MGGSPLSKYTTALTVCQGGFLDGIPPPLRGPALLPLAFGRLPLTGGVGPFDKGAGAAEGGDWGIPQKTPGPLRARGKTGHSFY